MKVKYLFNDGSLKYEGVYNVFAIQDEGKNGKKIYLSDSDSSGRYYISPYEFEAFEIIDTKITKFWEYGINQFGDICLGIPEIFIEPHFWEKYYNDDDEINDIVRFYYRVGKDDLFNTNSEY